MTDETPPKTFPSIQGRCPACRGDSLFIGTGGYVTCSRIDCPNPSAADQLLHGETEAALTRVRALRDDMRGSSDTRWLADQLTTALDTPSGPATTQAGDDTAVRCPHGCDVTHCPCLACQAEQD